MTSQITTVVVSEKSQVTTAVSTVALPGRDPGMQLEIDNLETDVDTLQGEVATLESSIATLASSKENVGVAATLLASHTGSANPHTQYLLTSATTTFIRSLLLATTSEEARSILEVATNFNAVAPLNFANNTLTIAQASTNASGYLSSADWNTFNSKQNALGFVPLAPSAIGVSVQAHDADLDAIAALATTNYGRSLLTLANAAGGRSALELGTAATANTSDFLALSALSATSPLAYNSSTGAFSIQQASGSQSGFLSSADWNTFNSKQNFLGFTPLSPSDIGTTVQAYDADLVSIAALATTSYGRSLLTLADAAAGRTSFNLGSAATANSSDFATAAQGVKADTALQPIASPSNNAIARINSSGAFINSGAFVDSSGSIGVRSAIASSVALSVPFISGDTGSQIAGDFGDLTQAGTSFVALRARSLGGTAAQFAANGSNAAIVASCSTNNTTPLRLEQANTTAANDVLELRRTPAAGVNNMGNIIFGRVPDTGGTLRRTGQISMSLVDATPASWRGDLVISVGDSASATRTALQAQATGSAISIGIGNSANVSGGIAMLGALTVQASGALQTTGNGAGSVSGNSRGTGAIDLQVNRSVATQVASAQYAAILGGRNNTAAQTDSVACGNGSITRWQGSIAHANGSNGTVGDAQSHFTELRGTTTNGALTELTSPARLTLQDNSIVNFTVRVSGLRTDVAEYAAFMASGAIYRGTGAATTVMVASVTPTTIGFTGTGWDCSIDADTTNGSLRIRVQKSGTVKWVCGVQIWENTA